MSKYILATLLVLLLVGPVGAAVDETNGTDPDITISLTIPCYTQVYWNNTTDDHQIVFSDLVQDGSNTGDWYRATADGVRGAYGNATKASTDPWAEGYYESYDTAFFWFKSNCDVPLKVTPSGDLSDGNGHTLPSWYTISFTNGTGSADGFINNGTRVQCGTIPMDGPGTYAQDSNGDLSMTLFSCTDDANADAFYPNQWPFPMAGAHMETSTDGFTAFAEGTVLFHARVQRSGVSDVGGTYTGSIDMTW